jgi:hypothetical protein
MRNTSLKYRIWIAIFIAMIGRQGFASPQLPDYLIFKGDTLPIYNLILEDYFNKTNIADQGDLFGLKFREGASLNCWRGYQAIYEIDNDSLFLTHIISCWELNDRDTINIYESNNRLKNIFFDKIKNSRVFVNWFTDNISIPNGRLLRWDGVFYKIFENEILVSIEKGLVYKIKELNNYIDETKRLNRHYNDTISTVIFNELKKVKWKSIDIFDCSEAYLITIGGNGKVSKVKMAEYQTREQIKESWDRREYNYCIRKVKNALGDLEFDIIKHKGKPYSENVYLEIWFEEDGTLENWTN